MLSDFKFKIFKVVFVNILRDLIFKTFKVVFVIKVTN